MGESLGGLGIAAVVLLYVLVSLSTGRLYTRRSYLDLLAGAKELSAAKDERIADLKESVVLLRATVAELEAQKAMLLSARRPDP